MEVTLRPSLPDVFATSASTRLESMLHSQRQHIAAAGDVLAAAVGAGGVIQAFGTGHSEAVALEVAGRAGGFVPTNKLALRDLVILGGAAPESVDTYAERDPDTARRVFDLHDIRPSDAFVIASNSGGNGSTVEMARLAKEKQLPVIAITSLEHSHAITSRHPCGKRLFEIADIVIDNRAPYGDALLETEHGPVCAVSSITSAMAVQMMVAHAIDRLTARGFPPPTYLSANIAGSDERNQRLEARYKGRINRSAL
jgi:uncharacterized phosphosugar-binding protein